MNWKGEDSIMILYAPDVKKEILEQQLKKVNKKYVDKLVPNML